MKTLKVTDNVSFEFDRNAKWEKDGKTFTFISLKKITEYKENKKYQNLTIRTQDWELFREWMEGILNGEGGEVEKENVPF